MNIIFRCVCILIAGSASLWAQVNTTNITIGGKPLTYEVRVHGYDFTGAYYFSADLSAVTNAPSWSDQSDCPPLSPRKAVQIAQSIAKTTWPGIPWNLLEIKLDPTSINSACWYYVVVLEDGRDMNLEGVRYSVNVLVLMDGSIPAFHHRTLK